MDSDSRGASGRFKLDLIDGSVATQPFEHPNGLCLVFSATGLEMDCAEGLPDQG
ncbi:MAG: hypothetical protein RL173_12 [Fibrobacterota bacterium]